MERIPVDLKIRCMGVTPDIRATYRHLRNFGFARYDVNMMVIGMVVAVEDQGRVTIRKID